MNEERELFKLIKFKDIEFFELNNCTILNATDENGDVTEYIMSQELIDYVTEKTNIPEKHRKTLFHNCKKAFDTLMKTNFNKKDFLKKEFIVFGDRVISFIDPTNENYKVFVSYLNVLNAFMNGMPNDVQEENGIIEIKFCNYKDNNGNNCEFIDYFIDLNNYNYKIFCGYETIIGINNYQYTIIPVLDKAVEYDKKPFSEFICQIDLYHTYLNIINFIEEDKNKIKDEKYFYGCTADLLLLKLKKFKVKLNISKKTGKINSIRNFNYYLGNKMIEAINSVDMTHKEILKSENTPIEDEHKFMTIEFLTLLTGFYYIDEFDVTINDIYEFIISLDVKAPEPVLQDLYIGGE